jgi:hypothetical protein
VLLENKKVVQWEDGIDRIAVLSHVPPSKETKNKNHV